MAGYIMPTPREQEEEMASRVLVRKGFSPRRGVVFQLLRGNSASPAAAANGGSNVEVTKGDFDADSGDNASLGRRRRFRAPSAQHTFPGGAFDLWSPIGASRSMRQMMDVVNSMLDPEFLRAGGGGGVMPGLSSRSLMRTPWDIVERKDAYHLRIDMPGFDKEDVKIQIEDDEMVIKAERGGGGGSDANEPFEVERSMNTRMALPTEAKREEIKAELKNGVLTVVVPKAQEAAKQPLVVNVA